MREQIKEEELNVNRSSAKKIGWRMILTSSYIMPWLYITIQTCARYKYIAMTQVWSKNNEHAYM